MVIPQLLLFTFGLISICLFFFYKPSAWKELDFVFILTGGFLLRLTISLDPCLHDWDEKFHALVSSNLFSDFLKPVLYKETPLSYAYQNWTANHIWLHKQPFTLWMMSISIQALGESSFAVRFPSLLLSTACIYMTYKLGLILFTKREALWASLFVSLNGFVIEIAGGRAATDHVDTFFFFLVLLGIYIVLLDGTKDQTNRRNIFYSAALIGFICGCAVLCKWLTGFIILPLFIFVNLNKPLLFTKISILLFTAIIVFIPWQLYASSAFPIEYWYEFNQNSKHFTDVIEGHAGSWFFYLDQARINWNELIYLPIAWLLYQMLWKRSSNKSLQFLFIWILIPYVIFSLAKTKMSGYVLFTAPAIFLLSSYFIFNVLPGISSKLSKVFLIFFTCLSIRYCIERVKPFQSNTDCISSQLSIKHIDEFLGHQCPDRKAIILNSPLNIEIMYFTNHIAYGHMPSSDEVNSLIAKDYCVLIVGSNLSNELKEIPGVMIYDPSAE